MFTWSVCGVSFDLWRWAPSPIYHGLPSNCHCLMSGLNPGILPANWKDFTKFLGKMMDKNIPSKTTSIRHNLPWLNSSLKRMIRKKQRLYNKAKCTKKRKDWNKYNSHKKETLKALRKARWNYINNMLLEGLVKGGSDSPNNPKF